MLKLYVCMNGYETLLLDEKEFLIFRLNGLGKKCLIFILFLEIYISKDKLNLHLNFIIIFRFPRKKKNYILD